MNSPPGGNLPFARLSVSHKPLSGVPLSGDFARGGVARTNFAAFEVSLICFTGADDLNKDALSQLSGYSDAGVIISSDIYVQSFRHPRVFPSFFVSASPPLSPPSASPVATKTNTIDDGSAHREEVESYCTQHEKQTEGGLRRILLGVLMTKLLRSIYKRLLNWFTLSFVPVNQFSRGFSHQQTL
ncbi:hypothetical protein EDD15DRAFT_2298113, partial [Pisolithus albus]